MSAVIPPDPNDLVFVDSVPERKFAAAFGPSKWIPIFEALKGRPEKWAIVRRYDGNPKLASSVASQIRIAAKPRNAFEVITRGDTVYARARITGE